MVVIGFGYNKIIQAWVSNRIDRFPRGRCHNTRAYRSSLFSGHSNVWEKFSHQGSDGFSSLKSNFHDVVACRELRGSSGFLGTHALCLIGHGSHGLSLGSGLTECLQ